MLLSGVMLLAAAPRAPQVLCNTVQKYRRDINVVWGCFLRHKMSLRGQVKPASPVGLAGTARRSIPQESPLPLNL